MPGPEVQSLPEALKCIICTDLYSDPCVFDCGHCFCGYCGCEWLKSSKTCPKCRAPVIRRPTPVYSLQDIVDAYKRSIGEQVVVYNDKVNWTELYPENKTSYIQDNEDMVRRCVQCSWELDEFNKCEKCDIKYTVVDDEETYLTDEDEEEEEEEEDLHGFVVDDDVIEYSDATDHGESEEAVDLDDGEEVWEDDEDEGDESGLDGTCGRDEEGNDEEGMFGGVCAYDIGELPYSDEDTGHSDYGDHNEEIDLSEDIDHSDQDDIDPSDQGDIYHSDQGDIHSVHGDIHSVHGDIVLGDMDQSDEEDDDDIPIARRSTKRQMVLTDSEEEETEQADHLQGEADQVMGEAVNHIMDEAPKKKSKKRSKKNKKKNKKKHKHKLDKHTE